jgi:hypothetical protein
MNIEEIEMVSESNGPWTPHLELMEHAVAMRDPDGAIRAWREAYAAALGGDGWQGLVAVAGACLQIGEIPGFRKACEAKARQTYWTALFRARHDRSVDGILRVAEAFGALGARGMAEECLRIAGSLTV